MGAGPWVTMGLGVGIWDGGGAREAAGWGRGYGDNGAGLRGLEVGQ